MAYGDGEAADWSVGDVAQGSTQTVGGAVSGLSGTVVLADNGADQLTLSANGPFTFATPVAQGAAYQVTVAQQPTGQTCTGQTCSVTNGAGTVATSAVTNVSVSCTDNGSGSGNGSATDDFARANGPLRAQLDGFRGRRPCYLVG